MPFTSLVDQLPFSIRTEENQLMNKDDRLHMRCWLLVARVTSTRARQLTHIQNNEQ